jgi:hypothetical protein
MVETENKLAHYAAEIKCALTTASDLLNLVDGLNDVVERYFWWSAQRYFTIRY